MIGIVGVLLCVSSLSAQTDVKRKTLNALRITESITVDGTLDEAIWKEAEVASDFIEFSPNPGTPEARKTEVKVLYDDRAIYVGAFMHEPGGRDAVLAQLTGRDAGGMDAGGANADVFAFVVDPYQSGIDGSAFFLTAAGVQSDMKFNAGGEDFSWDAVWDSEARITDEGWYVELRIPYMALRFPDQEVQQWWINFGRGVRSERKELFWNEVNPQINGFLNQSGVLDGLRDIKPPIRLSAMPYVTLYANNFYDGDADPRSKTDFSVTGGADVRYGINEAFTLDMVLIPDFGQARTDDQILNLGPFEQEFAETRQFFQEGIELFQKGGLFYTRRVGGTPIGRRDVTFDSSVDTLLENPRTTNLYNATKISGRTTGGTGIGVFNAVAAPQHAILQNKESGEKYKVKTSPLTNYNVMVLDQNLPNNSYATLINTNVWRDGGRYYDANVTGTEFQLRNKANSWMIEGSGALSQKYYNEADGGTSLGHRARLALSKISGNYTFRVGYIEESDTYDPNDLGLLFANNERGVWTNGSYAWFEPFELWGIGFNNARVGYWTEYSRLYSPDVYTDWNADIWWRATTRNFITFGMSSFFTPLGNRDYFEPRLSGLFFDRPRQITASAFVSTDYTKTFALDVRVRRDWYENGQTRFDWRVAPRMRVSDKFSFVLGIQSRDFGDELGFASTYQSAIGNQSVFGIRDREIIENLLTANYIFNNRMDLSLRVRHYWSRVRYAKYEQLMQDGSFAPTDFDISKDTNYDAFSVDAVYRWRFAPGSDIIVVYKNTIQEFREGLGVADRNYFDNTRDLFTNAQLNGISFRVIYFLDYLSVVGKGRS